MRMKTVFKTVLLVVLLTLATSMTLTASTPVTYAQGGDNPSSPSISTFERLPQFTKFRHLGVEQGLSNSTAWHVMKDSQGYIWIATFDGLNRYDGYTVTVYKHDPENPKSLSSSFIKCVFEDSTGTIWVGTASGFNAFNPETEQFVRYAFDQTVSETTVDEIYEDTKGRLWIGSWHGVLYQFDRLTEKLIPTSTDMKFDRITHIVEDQGGILWIADHRHLTSFDPETEIFTHYTHDPDNPNSLSHHRVAHIEIDHEGVMWLSTMGGGVNRFDPKTEQFTHYRHDPADLQSLSSDAVMAILEDEPGIFWVATFGGGLNKLDSKTGKSIRYQPNPYLPDSLGGNRIPWLFKDENDTLWVGTFSDGVNMYNPLNSKFTLYQNIPDNPQSLSHNEVWSIYQDQSNAIWIGTVNGLDTFDPETRRFTHYQQDSENPHSLNDNHIQALYVDNTGILWIGTWKGGLNRFDPKTEQFLHYMHDPQNPASLSHNEIQDIVEDRFGNLWIATYSGGLNRFNRETGVFKHYLHDPDDPHSLSSNIVFGLYVDRSNVLWIGSNDGLNRFDAETEQFTRYTEYFTGQQVYDIYESGANVLWVGGTGGLSKFHPESGSFSTYTIKDGLASETIYGILEDAQGTLWLSTAKGISAFDPITETVENFDSHSGLQTREFVQGSAYKARDGQMFFGGKAGLNSVFPDKIQDNPYIPPVVLTDFKIANQSVKIGEDHLLRRVINATDKLTLSYEEKVFSFEFAALNYVSPEKNQYKYMLEGFENEWNEVDSARRLATYTNLDPGQYVFRVKGSNNDGLWNEEGVSVNIIITPPWWQTWWAYTLYVLAAAGGVLGFVRWRLRTSEAQRRRLEVQVAERTYELGERVKELNCLYDISKLVETPDISLQEIVEGTVALIPSAWQYPEVACARITLEGQEFSTENFAPSPWQQTADILVHGEQSGVIQVGYLQERPESEGPFLKEERNLINAIAKRLGETTERMRAEQRVREQRQFLQTILDSLTHPLYVINAETHIVEMANAAAHTGRLCGDIACYTLTHGTDRPCREPEHLCPLQEVSKTKTPVVVEHAHIDKAGNTNNVEVHGFPILDGEGNVVQVIEYTLDITERKQIEAQGQRLAALEERERIGRELHDDLGQVMGYVSVQTQAALTRLEQKDQEQVRAILQQLAQLARDAHDDVRGHILGIRASTQIPGIRAGESRPSSDFFATLQEYTDTLYERYGLAIQVSRPEEMPSSPLAPETETQLLRIIQEGLTNVCKHANVDTARLLFTLHPDEMQIVIQDEGRGFAPPDSGGEDKEGHFGLQIMRERAEAVDGRLDIRSAPGQGTQVIARVPRVLQVPAEQIVRGLRVLLADDHPLFLEGLRNMLSSRGVQVVGSAHDGLQAQEMARRLRPDVILMDIHMPHCDGLEATRRIKIEMPEIKIAMLTMAAEDETLFTALKNGASGYLLKNLESGKFFDLLTDLQRGEIVLAPRLAARLLTEFTQPAAKDETPSEDEPSAQLTQRQLEILRQVAQGVTYKEIAAMLHFSERTVKYHMGRILEQLQLESRAEAIAYAHQKGLVDPES